MERRHKISIPEAQWDSIFDAYVNGTPADDLLLFGSYVNKSRTKAVDARSLLKASLFLDKLLEVCPTAQFFGEECDYAFHRAAKKHGEQRLTRTGRSVEKCATWFVKTMTVMCVHVRRLVDSTQKYQEAARVISTAERSKLKVLMGKVTKLGHTRSDLSLPDAHDGDPNDEDDDTEGCDDEGAKDSAEGSEIDFDKLAASDTSGGSDIDFDKLASSPVQDVPPPTATPVPKRRRKLDAKRSDDSSMGFLTTLKASGTAALLQKAQEVASTPLPGDRTAIKDLVAKRPAASNASDGLNNTMGKLRLECYKDRAYVRRFDENTGKWVSVVNVESTWAKRTSDLTHHEIAKKVHTWATVTNPDATAAACLSYRDKVAKDSVSKKPAMNTD